MTKLNYTFMRDTNASQSGVPAFKLDHSYHEGEETADTATAQTSNASPEKGYVLLQAFGGDVRVNIGASGVTAPTGTTGTPLADRLAYVFEVAKDDVIKVIDKTA